MKKNFSLFCKKYSYFSPNWLKIYKIATKRLTILQTDIQNFTTDKLLFREIDGLEELVNLKRLYLVSNKISKIQNLDALTQLEMLELGDNKIR